MNPLTQTLREWAQSQPLAIRPASWLNLIRAAIQADSGSAEIDFHVALGLAPASKSTIPTIAVLPLRGLVMQHESFWTELGLATSTDLLAAQIRASVADPNVTAIVLDIDSPGGGVYGVDETATAIREARDEKPVVAVANSQAASAAYWLASAASEIVVTPSGEIGSIGVFAEHWDASGFYAQLGLVPTVVKAGKYKAEFSDLGPLDEAAKAELQRAVDEYYELFVAAVAKGRKVPPSTVRADYGEGRMLSAKRAVTAGMADRVATLDTTIMRFVKARRSDGAKAEFGGADLETRRRRLRFREREV